MRSRTSAQPRRDSRYVLHHSPLGPIVSRSSRKFALVTFVFRGGGRGAEPGVPWARSSTVPQPPLSPLRAPLGGALASERAMRGLGLGLGIRAT